MSLESAKAFVQRYKDDEEFRASLQDLDGEEMVTKLKDAGFEFTEEEYNGVKTELSDDELDVVAGGGILCGCIVRVCSGVFGL